MNLILLFESDFEAGALSSRGGRVALGGRRADYLRSVHRVREGDRLRVGLLDGLLGVGEVVSVGVETVELEVELAEEPPAPLPLALVLALPRPLVLKRVLIAAASLGCKKIFLIQANRVERSFWNSRLFRDGGIREALLLGLEQAVDTRMPTIETRTRFKPFVEDELPGVIGDGNAYVAHPGARAPCPRDLTLQTTLVVGPEGGFVPHEIGLLEAAGCRAFGLGPRILRVETAIAALLAKMF